MLGSAAAADVANQIGVTAPSSELIPKVSLKNFTSFAIEGSAAIPSVLPHIEVFTLPEWSDERRKSYVMEVLAAYVVYLDGSIAQPHHDIVDLSAAFPVAQL